MCLNLNSNYFLLGEKIIAVKNIAVLTISLSLLLRNLWGNEIIEPVSDS